MHPIIGRERVLAELEDKLQAHRLVTVVGTGGVGKTRLAVELGWRVLSRYPDGVWLVDLAPLSDPAMIANAAGAALKIASGVDDLTSESLTRRIRGREMLLIFDNCEHLAAAVAALIEVVISGTSAVTVLATSQQSLRVAEEQIYHLEPLAVAPVGALDVTNYGAVSLFVEAARRVDARFELSGGNSPVVAEICRRLDGIPLALEMAAARLPLLGVDALLAGLAERLSLLRGQPRRSDRRHLTLRQMVAWSYGLLDELDQEVFCRLAIFPGSFSLEAVLAIIAPLGVDRWDALDVLWRLLERSLIAVEHRGAPRYRLLETLRLFAFEQLTVSGEIDAVAEQHARYFADVFGRAEIEWETMSDMDWIELYRPEADNLRAALSWALAEPDRRQIALSLGPPGLHFLTTVSLIAEGGRYAERLVALIDSDTPPSTAAPLLLQAAKVWTNTFPAKAAEAIEQAVALYRGLDDRPKLGWALANLSSHLMVVGRHEEAKIVLAEAADVAPGAPSSRARLVSEYVLGGIALMQGDCPKSREHMTEALKTARAIGSMHEAKCLTTLSMLEHEQGNIDLAIERIREAAACAREIHMYEILIISLDALALYLLSQDNHREARLVAEEAFERLFDTDVPCPEHLELWARLGSLEGRMAEAARLTGYAESQSAELGHLHRRTPAEQREHDKLLECLRAELTEKRVSELMAEGARWTEAEAYQFAAARLVRR